MSLTDLAALGSFVSAVAVLISLIYLSLQVKAGRTQPTGFDPRHAGDAHRRHLYAPVRSRTGERRDEGDRMCA